MNNLVTDTHPLVWFMLDKLTKLPSKVKQAFCDAEKGSIVIWVPSIVLWEISLIQKAGKITLHYPLQEYIANNFGAKGIHLFDLQTEDILRADELNISNDAFDTIIVAMAERMGLPLITGDSQIHRTAPCSLFWD